ncbi:MAG: hypothetical protein M3P04_01640, partial [Actinomycetota bacterium]|nr:hypothetical protein [Actinomycetota bacterium]
MTPREKELLEQIRATYSQLDGWFARTSRQVETPQPGSELFVDDKVFPHSPISEIARISLAVSVENLRMIRVVIETGNLFPTAMFPPLRAALVGAAQAVWILSPDVAAHRRERALTVIAEEYAQLGKYYREGEKLQAGEVPADQWDWLNGRMGVLAALRGPKPARLVQTAMIAAALDAAFPGSPEKQHSGRLLWRQTSADAHVLVWGLAQRSSVQERPQRGNELAVLAAPGSLEHVAEAFLCAFELVRRGWTLF